MYRLRRGGFTAESRWLSKRLVQVMYFLHPMSVGGSSTHVHPTANELVVTTSALRRVFRDSDSASSRPGP